MYINTHLNVYTHVHIHTFKVNNVCCRLLISLPLFFFSSIPLQSQSVVSVSFSHYPFSPLCTPSLLSTPSVFSLANAETEYFVSLYGRRTLRPLLSLTRFSAAPSRDWVSAHPLAAGRPQWGSYLCFSGRSERDPRGKGLTSRGGALHANKARFIWRLQLPGAIEIVDRTIDDANGRKRPRLECRSRSRKSRSEG